MFHQMIRQKWLLASVLSFAGMPAAYAALGENIAVSARAMALGNAVTADPGGIEAIHFNPAGLTKLKGTQVTTSLVAAQINAYSEFDAPADYEGFFGYKDDPVIGQRSYSKGHALYIPGYGVLKLPFRIAAPTSGFSYNEPDSKFTFASMAYAPMLVAYDRSENPVDPTRFGGRMVIMQRITYLSPSVGYQVNDKLSVGLATGLSHQAMVMDTDFRSPNQLVAMTRGIQDAFCPEGGNPIDTLLFGLCNGARLNPFKALANMRLQMTNPMDPSINLGVLWEPSDSFAIGASYQPETRARLTGRYKISYSEDLQSFIRGVMNSALGPVLLNILGMPTYVPPTESGYMGMTMTNPAHFQIGTKWKVHPRVRLSLDASWTDWAQWNKFYMQFDQELAVLKLARLFGYPDASKLEFPRGYKSVWSFGYGMELDVTDRLKFRLGIDDRKSSIPQDKLDILAPLTDAKLYGVGLGYKVSKNFDIDLTAALMNTKAYVTAKNPSTNLNDAGLLNVVYNPYAGLDVKSGLSIKYGGVTFRKRF